MKKLIFLLIFTISLNPNFAILAQSNVKVPVFDKIKIVELSGKEILQKSVIITFQENELSINSQKKGERIKAFLYKDIKQAEYSYSKTPRWKTGIGMGAASILFPPLLLVAIPIGFTKHRRHWLTIRTENDYAVLKLSKKNRKLFIPTFETKTGLTVRGSGEEK
jgi:hypothetical protein